MAHLADIFQMAAFWLIVLAAYTTSIAIIKKLDRFNQIWVSVIWVAIAIVMLVVSLLLRL